MWLAAPPSPAAIKQVLEAHRPIAWERLPGEDAATFAMPVALGEEPLIFATAASSFESDTVIGLLRKAGLAWLGVMLFAVLLAALLADSVVRPLNLLTAAAERSERGEAFSLPDFSSPELQVLAGSLQRQLTATAARERAERLFGVAVEASDHGLALVGEDGAVRMANSKLHRLLEAGRADGEGLVGRLAREVLPWPQVGAEEAEKVPLLVQAKRQDATTFPAELRLDPVELEYEHLTLYTLTDRSELMQKLAKRTADLERTNAELTRFAHTISHDLKAPLRGIRNASEWLQEDLRGRLSADESENLDFLRSRTDRLMSLIDAVLSFSQARHGSYETQRVNVRELLSGLASSLGASEFVQLTVPPDLPPVTTPEVALYQVLQNLLSNALRFSSPTEDTQVQVTVAREQDFLRFSVRDRGPGIRDEEQLSIFEPFATGEHSQKDSTGVGLAICKSLVERFGGSIGVESNVGQGSTFWFTWPGSL